MLTNLKIEHLKPGLKTTKHADRDGLSLEVRPCGSKVFRFRFQWQQKSQTITIGHFPAISLAQARNVAAKYRADVQNKIDPRDANRVKETSAKKKFKYIAEQWYIKNLPRWRLKTHQKHLRSLERDIYPIIGDKPIDEIKRADLLQVIHPHEEKGHIEIAHRLHDRMKAVFDYALAAGITEHYPFHGLKKAITPKPKIKNQVAINPNEAHEMLHKLQAAKTNEIIKLYVELLAHLFVRPSELRLAKWSEFNLQQTEWNVPSERMKMDAPHWIPLSTQALTILRKLRILTGFTPYVFNTPSAKIFQPISETSARTLIHKIGYKDRHTLHGFRSLASSVLHAESNFRSDAIEAQLAHKVHGIRGVYMRADFKQERKKMMEWYSLWLLSQKVIDNKLTIQN